MCIRAETDRPWRLEAEEITCYIFHGVEETDREDCMVVGREFIRQKCKVTADVVIERAHRLGRSLIFGL